MGAPTWVCDQLLDDALERLATGIDGLDSAGKNATSFERFVYAYDDPAWARLAADELSSCSIAGLAVLDCLGYESPQTDTPYCPRLGRAVSDLVTLALEINRWLAEVGRAPGWFDTTQADTPLPSGPYVALIGNNAGEGLEHVFVGLGAERIVEGGQASLFGRGYRINRGSYALDVRKPGHVWAHRTTPNPGRSRRLRGYLDLRALPFTQATTLPP